MSQHTRHLSCFWILAAAALVVACDVKVKEGGSPDQKDVDIRSPVGDLSVRTNVDASGTGLPVYPGASPVKNERQSNESADVNIGFGNFGLQVIAAKYQSSDAPASIVAFYKDKLQSFGEVVECRGEIDFEGDASSKPVCREQSGTREIQLAAGTERNHRLVAVEPRPQGAEFAVVYIRIGGGA